MARKNLLKRGGHLFPCKNCLLLVYRKYPGCSFKLKKYKSEDRLLVFGMRRKVKEESVDKMTPGCRFCSGYNHYVIGH